MIIDYDSYRFIEPTFEEMCNGIITKLNVVVTGVKLADGNQRVRINNIQFVTKGYTPSTLQEYKDVDVIFPDLSEIDECQRKSFKYRVFNDLYVCAYLNDPKMRARMKIPARDDTLYI